MNINSKLKIKDSNFIFLGHKDIQFEYTLYMKKQDLCISMIFFLF